MEQVFQRLQGHGVLQTVWPHCDEAQQIGCGDDWKIVCCCRTQASSHSSQGVADGGVDKAGVSTAAPGGAQYAAVEWTRAKRAIATLLLQHPSPRHQTASRVRRVMSASCEVTRGDT